MVSNPPQSPGRKNLQHLIIGSLAVLLLIGAKYLVGETRFGHWLNARGYEMLHSFLPNYDPQEDLPVVVLDISDLKRDPSGVTPPRGLQEIVEALVESRAKAVAIDIDFSPRVDPQEPLNTGARSEADEEFFEFLHEQRKKGVPVFVGVYNIGVRSESWLGTEENKDLAADMTLFNKDSDSTEVRAWLQCPGSTRLNSISKALAEAYAPPPQPPLWMRGVLVNYEDEENLKPSLENDKEKGGVSCLRAFTLVNYGKLELIQRLALQTPDRNSILGAKDVRGHNRFQDKLVIIGNGQRDKATDSFVIISRNEPVLGVYVHAVAAYTLVADPVYKFKHGFAVLLDGLLGAFIIVGLFVVRMRGVASDGLSAHSWESLFIFISILLTLSLGFVLVKVCNVLWLDFLLVILALLLHSKVQNGLAYVSSRIFKTKPATSIEGHP